MLRDRWDPLIAEWSTAFAGVNGVDVASDDFFAENADALASPANSFGIMDGGLDLAIRAKLGVHVEERVQERILTEHHGELPVGSAFVVPTDHEHWPYLVVAPTMRVPEPSGDTLNAYLAFRALLLAIAAFNEAASERQIKSVVVSGFCTGIGGMAAKTCAVQMRRAHDQVGGPAEISDFERIHGLHRELRAHQ